MEWSASISKVPDAHTLPRLIRRVYKESMGTLLHLVVRTLQSDWQTSGTEKMVLAHSLLLSLSTMTNLRSDARGS